MPQKRERSRFACLLSASMLAWALFAFLPAGSACAAPRVVTLAPSLTEMVSDLGCAELLAGVSDDPEGGMLPSSAIRIGPYNRPSLERIAALRPGLVLAIGDGTPKALLNRLGGLGLHCEVFRIGTVEELPAAYRRMGRLLGAEKRAEEIDAEIRRRLASADAAVRALSGKEGTEGREKPAAAGPGEGVPPRKIAAAPPDRAPRVLFAVQRSPLVAAGGGTFIASVIRRAGFECVPEGGKGYPLVGRERLYTMRPALVLDATPEGGLGPFFPSGGRIVRVAPGMFSRPSLRALDALDALLGLRYDMADGGGLPDVVR